MTISTEKKEITQYIILENICLEHLVVLKQ